MRHSNINAMKYIIILEKAKKNKILSENIADRTISVKVAQT